MVVPEPDSDGDPGAVQSSAGSVALEADPGGVATLRVTGALDLVLAPKMRQLVERAGRGRPSLLIIDLAEVVFLGSIGMAELLRALRQPAPVRLVVTSMVVRRPLQVTRLIDEFDVYPSLEAAVTGR